MRNIFFTLIFLVFGTSVFAQQEAHYTHFMYNTLSLNPAVAGSKGHPTVLALYRQQWIGFDNAAKSYLASFHTPLGKRVGLGLTIENDKLGVTNSWRGTMAYAYRIQLEKETTVQVGIQGSMRYLGIDFNKPGQFILNANDPSILEDDLSQKYVGNFGAGIFLNAKQMFFGASVPNFFPNTIGVDATNSRAAQEVAHFYMMAGAMLPINNNILFRPSALAKMVKNSPFDLDINLSLVFNQALIAGVSYRLGGSGIGESIDFLFHYRFNNIGVGLSYDYTLSELNNYNKGSVEAIVVYDFVKERLDMANPRFFY